MNSTNPIQQSPADNTLLPKTEEDKKEKCSNCNGCHCVLKEKTQEILNKLTSIK
jgi:predicted methyltransferase